MFMNFIFSTLDSSFDLSCKLGTHYLFSAISICSQRGIDAYNLILSGRLLFQAHNNKLYRYLALSHS